jgi:hypothetical protein
MTLYPIVPRRLYECLEHGRVPWQRPWSGGELPNTLFNQTQSRGVPVWLLAAHASPCLRALWRREQSDHQETDLFVAQGMTARRRRSIDSVHEVEQQQGAAPGAQDIVRPHGNIRHLLGRVGQVFPAQAGDGLRFL